MFMSKKKSQLIIALGLALCSTACVVQAASATESKKAGKPQRVLVVVFDQMAADYSERFKMQNVLKLEKEGVHFKNGYLGHLASETVVSHNVMVSGVFPKNMGWVDEVYRDTQNLLGKGANTMWETGSFTFEQFSTLVKANAYPKLADYLHLAKPGSKFIVVGEKDYAVESIAAPSADIAVRMSSRMSDVTKETGCDNLQGAWRYPAGQNVPSYLSEPKCGRFYINSDKSNDYGTKSQSPSWTYPLDGNRMVPGNDPEHLGGDAWVADAAMAMMEKENWSGMLITLGGIDKAGHMWGAYHDQAGKPGSIDEQTHTPNAARFADDQLGRIIAKLEALNQLDETIIIITADHGGTYAKQFYGNDQLNSSGNNWLYGAAVNSENYDKPIDAIKPLIDTGNVQFNFQSTSVHTWLKDNSKEKKQAMAKTMRALPGMAATYWRDGDHFVLDAGPDGGTSAKFGASELAWWKQHGQELADTMAAENGPDVLGVLADEVSYGGAFGDHGSAKQSDQRVPMIIWSTHIKADKPTYGFRTVDILPTVLKALDIPQTKPTDGKVYPLTFK